MMLLVLIKKTLQESDRVYSQQAGTLFITRHGIKSEDAAKYLI